MQDLRLSAIASLAWRFVGEPLLRLWPTYPPDWERRRAAVYERAMGRCESCGFPAGRFAPSERGWRVTGAHVHHLRPIAAGGRHALANLLLLCVACHRAMHPDNPAIGVRTPR
ncbi:MAG TPA: HNH endonuclease signature motif containing protein [Thermoanaerobaculia bacterium]|nr:HNH endonuclease signature motif containing protein [Thermoanaerobaculia bacterium]